MQVTDAANEARDNIKYLATLEHSLEPLYTGSPAQMAETLPSLLGSIRMMHTIARFYSQPARMTAFLQKASARPSGCDPAVHDSRWSRLQTHVI